MTNVLRKKIDAATGMPTNIARDDGLWHLTHRTFELWIENNLSSEVTSSIVLRKIVTPEFVFEQIESGLGFHFSPEMGSPLSAVVFDRTLGQHLAAYRMAEKANNLGNPSDIFLRLINEGPAESLRADLRAALEVVSNEQESHPGNEETEGKSTNYLRISMRIALDESEGFTDLYFDCYELKQRSVALANSSNKTERSGRPILRDSVQKSRLRLDAVLQNVATSVGACARMQVGDILPLTASDMASVALNVQTLSGPVVVSTGEVGKWHQNRALRLGASISQDFLKGLVTP